jgi:hypothetical protein
VTDLIQPDRGISAPVKAGRLRRRCGRVRFSTGRERGDSLLDAAHRFNLLFDAFGDLGLLAGHLDSLLADAVAG